MSRTKIVSLIYQLMLNKLPVAEVRQMLRQTAIPMIKDTQYSEGLLFALAEKLVDEFLGE